MEEKIVDRRTHPDTLVKINGSIAVFFRGFIIAVSIFSWILIASIFIFSQVAKFSKEHFDMQVPVDMWKYLFRYVLFIMVLLFVMCVIGLVLEFFRHHRKTDKYDKVFIVFGILSIIGIIAYFFLSMFI